MSGPACEPNCWQCYQGCHDCRSVVGCCCSLAKRAQRAQRLDEIAALFLATYPRGA